MSPAQWALLVAATTFGALLLLTPHPPLHPDSSRDLALAADCAVDGLCATSGAPTSLANLQFGALWLDLLAAARQLGLGSNETRAAFLALVAAAVGALALGGAQIAGRSGAVLAASTSLIGFAYLLDGWLLWNPLLLPLPCALLVVLTVREAGLPGGAHRAILQGLLVATALEAHPVAATLLPGVLAVVAATARRPEIALPAMLATTLGAGLFVSGAAVRSAVLLLPHSGGLQSVLLASSVAVAAGLLWRRKAAGGADRRRDLALGALFASSAVGVLAGATLQGHHLSPHYLLPAVPAVSLGLARLAPAQLSASVRLLAASVAVVFLAAGSGEDSQQPWRLADAETLAGALEADGITYEQAWQDLEGPQCDVMLMGLVPWMDPAATEQSTVPGPQFSLSSSEQPGDVALGDDRWATIERSPRRVAATGLYCAESAGAETTCVRASGYAPNPEAGRGRFEGRASAREIPRAAHPASTRGVSWRLAVSPGSEPVRVTTWSLPSRFCSWVFVATDGFEPTEPLPSKEITLPASATGFLEVSLRCPDPAMLRLEDRGTPPCMQTRR